MKCRLCNLEMSKHDYYSGHKKTCEDRFGIGSTTVRSDRSSSSSSSSTDHASRREHSVSCELETRQQANQSSIPAGQRRHPFIFYSSPPCQRAGRSSQPASQPAASHQLMLFIAESYVSFCSGCSGALLFVVQQFYIHQSDRVGSPHEHVW